MVQSLDQSTGKYTRSVYMLAFTIMTGIFVFGTKEYNPPRTTSNSTYALSTVYQPSTTRDALIACGGSLGASLTLVAGQTATIAVQTSPDNVTYTTVATFSCGNTGTLVVGLNTVSTQSGSATIFVPRGSYFKLVPSGNGTTGALPGQQTLF